MTKQELKLAQADLYRGGRAVAEAGMRLRGTQYEADYDKVWNALANLNSRLVSDINKK